MHSDTQIWDSLFNIVLLLLWFRTWTYEDRCIYFNPYMASLTRVSNFILKILRPLFFGSPGRFVPAMTVVFIIVLRTIILASGAPMMLQAGFEIATPITSSILSCLLFSFLAFLVFIFMLWSIALIYIRPELNSPSNHTANTITILARPFTDIKPEWRPLALFLFGFIITAGVALGGEAKTGCMYLGGPAPVIIAKLAISSVACFVNILFYIRSFTILLIIGSLVSAFTASQNLMTFCHEWLNFLMGPLRKYPIRIGMFDITPMLFIVAIQIIHPYFMNILKVLYSRIQ
ncbi:MAG: hypothetical protein KAH23_06790 [Kiritimatiellae bacterium]|nr:hypothetical protein [Kiritimatiellia bacterium]